MHPAFTRIDHRPWPLPDGPWTSRQTWRDLLFAHWPVPASTLRPLVPPELEVQEFDGTSWIGVVPFRMTGVMIRSFPDVPWVCTFPELNVRLYVERDGRPGVWFLSLDASNLFAVLAARRFGHLPYYHARMRLHAGHSVTLRSFRLSTPRDIEFRASYSPISDPFEAAPGSLEAWLTERYCMYAKSRAGILYRTEIHHCPWPLQRAEARIEQNDLGKPHGLSVFEGPPRVHFSRRLDVVFWPKVKVDTANLGRRFESAARK